MADILIKNIELPKKGHFLFQISSNGDVWVTNRNDEETGIIIAKAIEIPPHGDLTEKSAFWDMLHEICVKCNYSGDIDRYQNRCIWCKIKEAYEKVYQTPTILEAST